MATKARRRAPLATVQLDALIASRIEASRGETSTRAINRRVRECAVFATSVKAGLKHDDGPLREGDLLRVLQTEFVALLRRHVKTHLLDTCRQKAASVAGRRRSNRQSLANSVCPWGSMLSFLELDENSNALNSMFESQVCVEHYCCTARELAMYINLLSVVCRCKICSVDVLVYVHGICKSEWGPVCDDAEELMRMAVNWQSVGPNCARHDVAKARHRAFTCFRYLHQNGCSMYEHTMMAAIIYKNLECMIYLLQNGIGELTADVVVACASAGSVDCLRYAIENGAPYSVHELLALDAVDEYGDVFRYLQTLERDGTGGVTGAIRRAQSALDDISDHIPEGTYLETMNALGEAHRRVRPRRDDD